MSGDAKKVREQCRLRVSRLREKRKHESEVAEGQCSNSEPTSTLPVFEDFEMIVDENMCENKYENMFSWDDSSDADCDGSSSSGDDSDGSDCDSSADEDIAQSVINVTLLMLELRKWSLKYKVTHSSLNSLLQILQPYHPNLPLSAKTLLKTDSKMCDLIKKFNPEDLNDASEYVYFGIARNLKRIIQVGLHKVNVIYLQFNIDGLPIFKSSSLEFWPILGKVIHSENFNYKPFIISIYSGIEKPNSLDRYFAEFISELNHLLKHGLEIGNEYFEIKIMCFVCDRPARSYIKNIKGHGGYYCCERCDVEGFKLNGVHMVYPITGTLRTDKTFRSQDNPNHHNGTSPLLKIIPPINMVSQFVLDIMHLIFLGVTKKLLECWLSTTSQKQNMMHVSLRLTNLSKQVPCEFQRTTRSLSEVSKWKATEHRFFLLYAGPFVLKGLLSETVYKHFLLLSFACQILCSDELWEKHSKLAKMYLKRFVLLAEKIYGQEVLVSNVHSLIHIVDDVEYFNCSLSKMTAFCFENQLGIIKKYIKHGKKPLVQVCKRVEEEIEIGESPIEILQVKVLSSSKSQNGVNIKRLKFYDSTISIKNPNNIVLLKNKTVVQVEKMESSSKNSLEKDIRFFGSILKILKPALEYPSSSELLDIYEVQVPNPSENQEKIEFRTTDIKTKMILQTIFELNPNEQQWYVTPLLHNI